METPANSVLRKWQGSFKILAGYPAKGDYRIDFTVSNIPLR